jgi:hypothetical protein
MGRALPQGGTKIPKTEAEILTATVRFALAFYPTSSKAVEKCVDRPFSLEEA